MPKTVAAAALPNLQLTEHDEFSLRQLGAQLRREIVSQYEVFLFKAGQQPDETRWKYMRSDDDMHAYCECKGALTRDLQLLEASKRIQATHGSKVSSGLAPQTTMAVEAQRRRVLVCGVQSGTLDDLMYGTSFQDEDSFRAIWETYTRKGGAEGSALLATIEGASTQDPYHFMGVTWLLRTFPLPNVVLNQRDLLTFTDSHLTKLSNGERVGVSITHSINHRGFPELREFDTVRAVTSVLRVVRQVDAHRVEVYMTNYLDVKSIVPEAYMIADSIKFMLPSTRFFVDKGFSRKLYWMARTRQRARLDSSSSDVMEPMSAGSNEKCELCTKTIGRIYLSPGTTCTLCYKRICSRCSISQDLPSTRFASTRKATMPADFCVQCIMQAKATSTLAVALDEAKFHSQDGIRRDGSSSGHTYASDDTSERTKTVLLTHEF